MMTFVWLGAGIVFFGLGLWQWARGGSGLWQILNLRRREKTLTAEERLEAEGTVHRLERATDRALLLSFRILGYLAIVLWLMLGASLLMDFLGGDWTSRFRARQYWNADTEAVPDRNVILRSIGSKLRK